MPVDEEGPFSVSFSEPQPSSDVRYRSKANKVSFHGKGGTNRQIDLANPDNLGGQPTDNGNVPNFKYSFSNSRTRLLKGGWVREQVITDLPQSHDIAGAQMHLKKGAMREMHWHRVVRVSPFRLDGPVHLTKVRRPNGASCTTAPSSSRPSMSKDGTRWRLSVTAIFGTSPRERLTRSRASRTRTSSCSSLMRPTLTGLGSYLLHGP